MKVGPLFEIPAQDLNQVVRGLGFRRIGFRIWTEHVRFDFALDDFGHEAVDRTPACRHLLQHCSAVPVFLNCILDTVQLPLDAIDTCGKFLLRRADMTQFR